MSGAEQSAIIIESGRNTQLCLVIVGWMVGWINTKRHCIFFFLFFFTIVIVFFVIFHPLAAVSNKFPCLWDNKGILVLIQTLKDDPK